MNRYVIKPLGPETLDDFARLIERQGTASWGTKGKGNCVMTATIAPS